MKNFMFACVGLCALAVAFYFASLGTAQMRAPSDSGSPPSMSPERVAAIDAMVAAKRAADLAIGRWTIVNGTPDMARHIMLLDTATGDSWIVCDSEDGATGWCRLERGDSTSALNSPASSSLTPAQRATLDALKQKYGPKSEPSDKK
jgi:hypothetical protein